MMSLTTTSVTSTSHRFHRWLLAGCSAAAVAFATFSAQAAGPQVPWECSNYSDEAQTRCLNAFIEHQREQIGKLEGQLQAQQDMVGQLKGQVDRQAATTAQLQQQLSQPPGTTAVVPAPYVYSYAYAYPPVGIGLYFGSPWIYGPGYYGRPFWGPRLFYGHWGRRW
jgi:hypothetical protein